VKGSSFLPALSSHAPKRAAVTRLAVVVAIALPLLAPALSASATTPLTVLASQTAAPVTAVATPAKAVVPAPAVVTHATTTPVTSRATVARTTLAVRAVAEARRHFGAPYQWGATGPRRFDCSGLTSYVFARLGVHLPRTAAAQYWAIRHVAPSHKRVGDLIFKYSSSGAIYHVGIYAGNGRMIAATHTGDVVRYSPVAGRYKVGRVR
jgi:cell wall-associated NlpC family hydrolase